MRSSLNVSCSLPTSSSGSSGPGPAPPRTHGAVIRGARAALRRFREDRAAGRAPKRSDAEPWRLLLDVPLPVASDIADKGLSVEEAPFGPPDEGDWPGGMPQRFRAFRQMVEPTLEGYSPDFLGMLESPADGLGVWRLQDAVLAGIAVNATVPSVLKLLDGGYGAQPTRGDQAVVLAAEWTSGDDVGQPWQRDLRARARALIDEGDWAPLYCARMVRTSRGRAHGLLLASWGEPWRLYAATEDDSSSLQDGCLLQHPGPKPPPAADVAAALLKAAERAEKAGGKSRGGFRLPW